MFKRGLLLTAVVALITSGCAPNNDVDAVDAEPVNNILEIPLAQPISVKVEEAVDSPESATAEKADDISLYAGVAYEITEKTHPDVYAAWGKEWVDNINTMMPLAVVKVATSDKCDAPEKIDISENRSLVQKEVVFHVGCANDEQFYVSQNELFNPAPLIAENDILNEGFGAYTLACEELTKTKVEYPSSYKSIKPDITAFKGSSGNMIVEIPFTSLNAYGADLPMLSRCIFSTSGDTEVLMTKR